MTVFDDALDVLFADQNMAVDAVWTRDGQAQGTPVRVVRSEPDMVASFNTTNMVQATVEFHIPISQAPDLARGDTIGIGTEIWQVTDTPRADSLRLTWKAVVRSL